MLWINRFLRENWRLAVAIGLVVALISLALLTYALLPPGEPVRVQSTLAPTWFVPPPGGLP